MNETIWPNEQLAAIVGKYESKGKSLSDMTLTRLTRVLLTMEPELGERAVNNVLMATPFLPSVEELQVEYARLFSPYPSVEEALDRGRGLGVRRGPVRQAQPGLPAQGPDLRHRRASQRQSVVCIRWSPSSSARSVGTNF